MTQIPLAFEAPEPAAHRTSAGPVPEPSAGPTPDASVRRVALSRSVIAYRLVRMRRRSLTISLAGGLLEARAPHRVPLSDIEAFIRSRERWILRRIEEHRARPAPFGWQPGERLALLGGEVTLVPIEDALAARLDAGRLLVPGATGIERRSAAVAWLRASASALFSERLAHYAAALGVPAPLLRLSDSRSEWGSCHRAAGREARVLLAWRLVQLPRALIDYVVAHEAAHLLQHNHSARFWGVVASIYPGYREARRELNRRARLLPPL